MKYQIISAFIDRRTGEKIDPGQPMPEGLDKDTIARLVQAQCLRPIEDEPAPSGQAGEGDSGTGLFPDHGGSGGASDDAAAAGAASQPTGGRRGRRSTDNSNIQ